MKNKAQEKYSQTEKGKEIILRECQDWVKKKFFTDDILSPKFGERKEDDN